eukprot:1875107-Rhodomonas_salina.2
MSAWWASTGHRVGDAIPSTPAPSTLCGTPLPGGSAICEVSIHRTPHSKREGCSSILEFMTVTSTVR